MLYLIAHRFYFVAYFISLFFFNTGYGIVPDSVLVSSDQSGENNIQLIDQLPFSLEGSAWADSVFNSLSSEERIAQLFMVAAYSNKGNEHTNEIEALIKDYKIGGLIFFKGGPARQAILTNRYQSVSKTPLLISIDAEWGLAMRLDSTIKYPRQRSEERRVGKECRSRWSPDH